MSVGISSLNRLLESGILQPQVSLANYTTWRVGGPAEWLAEPCDADQCVSLMRWAQEEGLTTRVIGAGSNLLVADAGLPGLTLCMRRLQGSQLNAESGKVKAWAGEPLPTLARRAAKLGLRGLEWAVGIPGTVGGAAVMNAGAQGGSTADCLTSVDIIETCPTDAFITTTSMNKTDLAYSYRHSVLQNNQQLVIAADFQLEPGHDAKELMRTTSGNLSHRTTTQPYQWPSCGSVFRNPEPEKAGQLIEKLGLKGRRIGGAEVSQTHANFIVNVGGATAADIRSLIDLVQRDVERVHGITLHPEVKRLGFQTTD